MIPLRPVGRGETVFTTTTRRARAIMNEKKKEEKLIRAERREDELCENGDASWVASEQLQEARRATAEAKETEELGRDQAYKKVDTGVGGPWPEDPRNPYRSPSAEDPPIDDGDDPC